MSWLGWLVILAEIAMVLGLALALVVPPRTSGRTSGWSHRPLRAIRRRTRRRVAVADFLHKLDVLGADEDTRTALLFLVALGMPADSIRRLGMAYAKGLRIEVVNDYYPGPPTPGVYGVRRAP